MRLMLYGVVLNITYTQKKVFSILELIEVKVQWKQTDIKVNAVSHPRGN